MKRTELNKLFSSELDMKSISTAKDLFSSLIAVHARIATKIILSRLTDSQFEYICKNSFRAERFVFSQYDNTSTMQYYAGQDWTAEVRDMRKYVLHVMEVVKNA